MTILLFYVKRLPDESVGQPFFSGNISIWFFNTIRNVNSKRDTHNNSCISTKNSKNAPLHLP